MAEAVYVQEGCTLDFTPTSDRTGGEVVQVYDGRAAVIPTDLDYDVGEVGAAQTEGIYTVTKTTSQVWVKGSQIWWDHSANSATCIPRLGAGDRDFYLGVCTEDVAAATTTGKVNLNVKPRYEIDLERDPFKTAIIKTVVGSTTVEVPHTESRGGGTAMILGTTAEAQKVDLLSERSFAVGSNWIVEGEINIITNSDNAAGDFNIGVASATHDTDADLIAESAFIHTNGNDVNIYAECDDGTNETAATDTTVDFTAGTPFSFVIDGRDLTDLHFYIDGVEVLASTTFAITVAAGPLKLLAHLEKTADDSPGTYVINRLRVRTMDQD